MFTGTPTEKLGLPSYNPNDHPDFLTDFNEAFKNIDRFALEVTETTNQLTAQISKLEAELSRLRIDCGLTS